MLDQTEKSIGRYGCNDDLPEGITVMLERWHLPEGVRITEKKNSLFCLLTGAVQSIKKTSGYFIVSRIISSEANEIIRTSFLSTPNVSSLLRSAILEFMTTSVFKTSVEQGRPRGRDMAHNPSEGSSYTIRQDISFLVLGSFD